MRLRFLAAVVTVVVVATTAVVLLARPSQPPLAVVDDWVIGPVRTCADLSLPQPRCDGLVARAIAAEPVRSAAIVGHTLHEVGEVVRDGQLGLATWGGRRPFGLVLIEYGDGSQHVVTVGCLGLPEAGDPLCPD